MARENLNDLIAFVAVARERSFTTAAAQMGLSQSGLSHKIRGLEARMGVRLLTRTTRSVSPTEAGERLLNTIGPGFDAIETEIQSLSEIQEEPVGTVRITAVDTAVDTFLWPRLVPLIREYPGINIEIDANYGLVDIVGERYDIGVRSGEAIARDMIAMRISPDFRHLIVGSPAYFERHGVPEDPEALLAHDCIALRLKTTGAIYAWPLMKEGREQTVRFQARFIFNGSYQVLSAALSGCGLAFSPEYLAGPHIAAGRLRSVLEDWSPVAGGFYAYYPSRRHMSRVVLLVLDALRQQA